MNTLKEIDDLINTYMRWVRDKTALRSVNDKWVEITTPHVDRNNDYLQFYVKKEEDFFVLTDDGNILTELENAGCTLDSPKRQELLRITLNGFGIKLEDGQLTTHARPDNFSAKKHNLIQAMLAVNDLFFLSTPFIASLFLEDVIKWMDLSDIRYTPKVKFTGKSGYDHMFDFVVPKSKQQPERLLQTLNNPKKDSAEALIWKWMDTKENRASESKLYAIMNDSTSKVSSNVIDMFHNYDLTPVLWSDRENVRLALAA